jgi:hypothetical protein
VCGGGNLVMRIGFSPALKLTGFKLKFIVDEQFIVWVIVGTNL